MTRGASSASDDTGGKPNTKPTTAYLLFAQATRADMNAKFGGAEKVVEHFARKHQSRVRFVSCGVQEFTVAVLPGL